MEEIYREPDADPMYLSKFHILAAEQALGLYESALGVGFLISAVLKRKPEQANGTTNSLKPSLGSTDRKDSVKSCPYELVTGRPLSP